MKEYVFDLSKVRSLEDWWDMYVEVVQGSGHEDFGRNRDAYSDSLDGGPACPELPCRFVFTNVIKLKYDDLINCTKQELLKKRQQCHPTGVRLVETQLELLDYGIGETILNWIIDPAYGHDEIDVLIKARA